MSHIFFADDLVLFYEATEDQVKVMKSSVDLFCLVLVQKMNLGNSVMFVSSNIHRQTARILVECCDTPLADDLGRYLGVPLLHQRVTKRTYSAIIEKVNKRLVSWKRKTLSLAGRVTLIKSVTSVIPTYVMQTRRIPSAVCEPLDKINRDFLWGSSEECRRTHLVNLEKVTLSEKEGGLGIRRSGPMNQALLCKAAWRIQKEKERIWAKMFHAKYFRNSTNYSINHSANCSSTWRGICHCARLLRQGSQWRVGHGAQIKFLTDVWLDIGPLP